MMCSKENVRTVGEEEIILERIWLLSISRKGTDTARFVNVEVANELVFLLLPLLVE